MFKKWMIGISILALLACSEPNKSKIDPDLEKNQLPSSEPNLSIFLY